MGTLFKIVMYEEKGVDVQEAVREAFARIEALEDLLSSHRDSSELESVSKLAFQSPQIVSQDLYFVLETSLELSRLTEGAFDVTVRPFVQLWKNAKDEGRLPSSKQLNREAKRVGYQGLLLNPRTRSLRFKVPGIQVDLGGIAKGYAADEVLRILREHHIESALVYAGGDIRLGAAPPRRNGWSVEVNGGRELLLRDCAIASSGDTFQYLEIEGVRYSHIIDPRTGLGIRGQRGATVIAPQAIMADALATALAVAGPKKGFEIIRELEGVSAQFVHYPEGKEEVYFSANFPIYHLSEP
jgi:thiamine biosynthesis lipoprotein